MVTPSLPSALSPLPWRPRTAALASVAVVVVATTVASFGMTLPLLLALAVALPQLAKGKGRSAAWALVIAGGLPLALGLVMLGCYQLDMAASNDPMYGAKNHETGFMAILFILGVGLPSLLAGAATGWLASRAGRWAERRSLDAADEALAWAGVIVALVGDGFLGLLRFAHISAPPTTLALPSLAVCLLGVTMVREIRRQRALGALFADQLPGLRLVARDTTGLDFPSLVDPGPHPLEAVVLPDSREDGTPYRESEARPLALAPAGLAPLLAASRRRLALALATLGASVAVVILVGSRLG